MNRPIFSENFNFFGTSIFMKYENKTCRNSITKLKFCLFGCCNWYFCILLSPWQEYLNCCWYSLKNIAEWRFIFSISMTNIISLTDLVCSQVWERRPNAWRLRQILPSGNCSLSACPNVLILKLSYFLNRVLSFSQHSLCVLLKYLCRYDTNTKELKHMNPLPQDILESLDGKLDFLGPYPSSITKFVGFISVFC